MNSLLTFVVLAVSSPTAQAAQTAPAQTAPVSAGQPLGGPLVPGVCLLSREAIFANAKVAIVANSRLKQLSEEAQAEIEAERKPIEDEARKLQAETAKLSAEQRAQREQPLAAKVAALQAKAQHRSREIEATRGKALAQISTDAQPLIAQVYKRKNCGLLVDRGTLLGGNFGNDLTAETVAALDAKVSSISFNREILPVQPAIPTR